MGIPVGVAMSLWFSLQQHFCLVWLNGDCALKLLMLKPCFVDSVYKLSDYILMHSNTALLSSRKTWLGDGTRAWLHEIGGNVTKKLAAAGVCCRLQKKLKLVQAASCNK